MSKKLEKTKKELAIITPSYNNGLLLKRLYKSIEEQTYKNMIWIVIDDGSTDNTYKILEDYRDKIITIHNKKIWV